MGISLRSIIDRTLVHWARNDEAGGALAYVMAALIDVSRQRLRSGVEARFPSRAGASGLALLGGDRLIPRGRDETDAHYAARLRAWRYPRGHRIRGSVFGLLEQISEYFGGLSLWGIDRRGNRRARALDGAETSTKAYPWAWDTGSSTEWARQWVVIDGDGVFSALPDYGDGGLWGGALGTLGHCIGIGGASAQDWEAIRRLTRGQHRWLPAGVQGEWLVVGFDSTPPVPSTDWAKWGVVYDSGSYTYYLSARSADHRYVALRSALREYAGDSDWASRIATPLGTVHAPDSITTIMGDDTLFPETISVPRGDYEGDSTVFPATITLPDDGSFPQ